MEGRLVELEARVQELTATVASLESRVARLEDVSGRVAPPEETHPPALLAEASPSQQEEEAPVKLATGLLALCGRSFLVLGGAYLIRALTEGGSFPRPLGVCLGLLYALASAFLADRTGRSGQVLSATFHGCLAVLIGYPLIWEASTRLQVLSPPLSAGVLLLMSALLVAVAWRQNLPVFAWAATLATSVSALGLMVVTHSLAVYTLVTLVVGGATLWLTYGRRWHGLRWPTAITADIAVIICTLIAGRSGGLPENYRDLSIPAVLLLSIALVAIYPGSFALRIVYRHRSVNAFEIVQTLLALLAGFGGAVRVAHSYGSGESLLGGAALLAAVGCYAVALAFVERREEWSKNFHFFTTLGLILALVSAGLVTGSHLQPVLWSVLGLASAVLAVRSRRITLRTHSAVYAVVAAISSGLLLATVHAFLLGADKPWTSFDSVAYLSLATTIASYLLLAARRDGELSFGARLPDLVLSLLAAACLGGVIVSGAVAFWLNMHPGPLDAGMIAVTRTAVLAFGALVLAGTSRRASIPELGWIAYFLLVVGGGKLIFEDMQIGSAAMLFPAFIMYGAALILVPKLLRQSPSEKDLSST